jgi:hypothetical protein
MHVSHPPQSDFKCQNGDSLLHLDRLRLFEAFDGQRCMGKINKQIFDRERLTLSQYW